MRFARSYNTLYRILCLFAGVLIFSDANVLAQPVANFTIATGYAASGCPPHTVKFQNQSTGATSYLWEFSVSAPNTSIQQDPQWVFYSPGKYTVKLTAYNGSQNNTMTKTFYITVHDTPKADFVATPTAGCAKLPVVFTNLTSGTNSYQWVFQGGTPNTSSSVSPAIDYETGGSFQVTLKATNTHGCVSSKTKTNYINIKPRPVVTFTSTDTIFCGGSGSASFTSDVTGNGPFTYLWNFGTLGSNVANPVNIPFYSPPATHTVRLTVTDANGCKDSLVKPDYIKFKKPKAGFQAPANVCEGVPVNFVNTTTPCFDSAKWYLDVTDSSTAINPIHAYMTPGPRMIKMITWCNGCSDTISKQITVNPLPVVDFTMKPDSPCPPPVNIQFIANATYSTYLWTFGSVLSKDAPTSNAASPYRNYTNTGFDSVTLKVVTAQGCSASITKNKGVRIDSAGAGIYILSKSSLCAPITVKFGASVRSDIDPDPDSIKIPGVFQYDYPYGKPGIKTYEWTFHDGTKDYTANPVKTYTEAGAWPVYLRITTVNGCVVDGYMPMNVGKKPSPSFTGPDRICQKDFLVLTNTTPQPFTKSGWDFGGPGVGSAAQGIWKYSLPGTYKVTFNALYYDCPGDPIEKTVIVDSPAAYDSIAFFCHRDSTKYVKFFNKSIGATSWEWDFGDGQTSVEMNPLHKYPASGQYHVRLRAYNANSNCYADDTFTINILNISLDITTPDTTICLRDTIPVTGMMYGSKAKAYAFVMNSSFQENITPNKVRVSFPDTGFYNVTLFAKDEHGCEHSYTKTRYIFVSRPYANFSANPPLGCTPLTVNLIDQSKVPAGATITNRYWTLGGSTNPVISASNATAVTSYLNNGAYNVKLVVTDNVGCKDSLEIASYINAYKPSAGFVVKDTLCWNTPATFLNNSTNYTKTYWDFGDDSVSSATNPDHKYLQVGTYTVRLIVEDNYGCSDTVTKKIAVTKPEPAFTMSDTAGVCTPLIINFTNNTTGPNEPAYTYLWDFGNGQSPGKNPTNAFVTPGEYKITLIATTPWGCQDSVKTSAWVYGFSGSLAYGPKKGCIPLEVTFTPVNLFNIPKVIWDFTDGNVMSTSQLVPVKHTYYKSGAFLPKLILEDVDGCKTTSEGLDTIKVDESWANFTFGAACVNEEMNLFDSSKALFSVINRWNWYFEGTDTSMKKNPEYIYTSPGQYNVRLIVSSSNSCKDTIEKLVTVHPQPVIDAGTDTTICLKDSATLMPLGGISYIWTPPLYLSCDTCPNPLTGPPKRQVYTVRGTDANGCSNTDTVAVSIKTKVEAFVAAGGEICDKDTFRLSAWGAHTYQWKPSESLDNSLVSGPLATPHTTTEYIVVAYEGRCIPDTNSVKVIVHPLPDVKAEGAKTIVAGNTADLRASGNLIRRFQWTPSENLTCSDCAFPTARPYETTTYTVRVYTDFGCVDSDKVTVTVLCDQSQLFIPNTFTPNGDGQNDVFYPRGTGMDKVKSFRIYNRWGEVVYQRAAFNLNDEGSGWDGTYKGNQLPPDVFVWVLEAQCDDEKVLTLKGDVTIIR